MTDALREGRQHKQQTRTILMIVTDYRNRAPRVIRHNRYSQTNPYYR